MTDRAAADLKVRLAGLAPEIARLGAQAEQDRALPPELVRLMADARLFDIFRPSAEGGLELDMADGLAVIEDVSAADPAAGWSLLKASTSNMLAGYLPEPVARAIWDRPGATLAGSLNPKGRAIAVDGGYLLTGRWDWAMIVPEGGAAPLTEPRGAPRMRVLLFPRARAELIDTWRTHGMRGTGSGDFAVCDLFVPEAFGFELAHLAPRATGPLYARVPFMAQMAVPHAAVAIGIARACLADFISLASNKTPLGSRVRLADKAHARGAAGRALAEIDASRAYVLHAVRDAWSAEPFTPAHALALGLSSVHATSRCEAAVDMLYRAAGGSAVFEASPIQRRFRDIHVAASHFLVDAEKYESAGAVALGAAASIL